MNTGDNNKRLFSVRDNIWINLHESTLGLQISSIISGEIIVDITKLVLEWDKRLEKLETTAISYYYWCFQCEFYAANDYHGVHLIKLLEL